MDPNDRDPWTDADERHATLAEQFDVDAELAADPEAPRRWQPTDDELDAMADWFAGQEPANDDARVAG